MRIPAVMALLASGCSIVAMRDAPNHPTAAELAYEPACTDSRVPMNVDGGLGGGALLLGLPLLGRDDDEAAHVGEVGTMLTTIGVVFLGSALVGLARARACDRAKERWLARVQMARVP